MNPTDPRAAYADHAWHGTARLDENRWLARDTYRARLSCPQIARQILPGQFIMIRLAGSNDPMLGRPLAVYDVVRSAGGEPIGLDVVYLTVGRMTRRMAGLEPGAEVEIWGPLGKGFPPQEVEHLVMVAGGIGQTPFLAVAREALGQATYGDPPRQVKPAGRVTLCYGVRSAEYLAGVEDFHHLGVEVHISTDDGSEGHQGLVTDLVPAACAAGGQCQILCCGPEPMIHATAKLAARLGVACQVSLETPMACGIGICFSCVTRIRDGQGGWDYRRTCVEGPVFPAEDVVFE